MDTYNHNTLIHDRNVLNYFKLGSLLILLWMIMYNAPLHALKL